MQVKISAQSIIQPCSSSSVVGGSGKATPSIHLGCGQNPRISLKPVSRRSRSSDSAPPTVLTALRKPGTMRLRRMRMLAVATHYPHVLFAQPPCAASNNHWCLCRQSSPLIPVRLFGEQAGSPEPKPTNHRIMLTAPATAYSVVGGSSTGKKSATYDRRGQSRKYPDACLGAFRRHPQSWSASPPDRRMRRHGSRPLLRADREILLGL